jgi:hypothetical protein
VIVKLALSSLPDSSVIVIVFIAIIGNYKSVESPIKAISGLCSSTHDRLTIMIDQIRVQVLITVQRGRGKGRIAIDWVDSVVDIAIEPDLGI